jgi:4-hydroxy-3-methylbut-2-enyl diphosphate reductase
VESAADLRAEWFAGVETVGITAGTSTPDEIINEVEHWLAARTTVPAFHGVA